jgi:hypothetical protein
MSKIRKSTWALIAFAIFGQIATIALALIVLGTVGWQAAVVVAGVTQLLVIVAFVMLGKRAYDWYKKLSTESPLDRLGRSNSLWD